MALVYAQNVAGPTKHPKIAHFVACQLAAFDMVDMASFQGDVGFALADGGLEGTLALAAVPLPDLAAGF